LAGTLDSSRRFYDKQVAPMISARFPEYENRIAVGVVGEGSDCFGYDDLVSRDHDFGTGVCLWLTEEDYNKIGGLLSIAYNELVDSNPGSLSLSPRLRARRGVMSSSMFYSNILNVLCDASNGGLREEDWYELDHTCLATAVNGEVFRDELGEFTRFRQMLLDYYPDRIWKIRMINELHKFASSVQVNYARCMTRGDIVAAEMCRSQGIESAMELVFLLKRQYPPYYKWTFRALTELEETEHYAELLRELAGYGLDPDLWRGRRYNANILNSDDKVIIAVEKLATGILDEMRRNGLTDGTDPYLEIYCTELQRSL